MSSLLIDAAILACPDPTNYAEERRYTVVEQYMERLSNLSKLRSSFEFVRFWRDETLQSVLHDENAYPFRHSLQKAFAYLSPEVEFQIQDANVLATALLERSLILENEGDIRDLIISNTSIVPLIDDGRPQAFVDQLFRMLALALPMLGDGQKLGPNVYLATQHANPTDVIASFQVDMIEEKNGFCQQCTELKKFEARAYVNPETMVKQIDILDLWNSSAFYKECIALQASQGEADPVQMYSQLSPTFNFGIDFVSSAKTLGFLHDSKKISRLLRVSADILLGRNLADTHPLRAGMGGNDAQRVRGKWSAWRHDIDYEFHLHYWKDGAKIEFANVVTHENFSITK